MARDEMIRLWGSPDEIEAREAGGHWVYYALLRTALVGLDSEGKVELIGVDDDSCMTTSESIVVGDTRNKVRTVYGQPSDIADAILSDILVKKKARLRIGTGFQDLYVDSYLDRGLTVVTGQTMHVNGYAPNGQPIIVAIEPEPLVRAFIVYARRVQNPMTACSSGGQP